MDMYGFTHMRKIWIFNEMIELISEQGIFNPLLHTYNASHPTIAIFGTQSSGKSTLLNQAFQTQFPELDTLKHRARCTHGVWLENTSKFNIIDTEGFDSVERKEQERIFEKQIALFCLVAADVLLVNVWMNEIGRYQGSHMQAFRIIFNAAAHLIKSQTKTVFFVVKDCSRDADHGILREELETEMQRVLAESQSAQKSKTLKFNFEYFFMSHYIYQPEEYAKEAKKLQSLIKIKKSSLHQYEPQDAAVYLKNIWQTIVANEGEIDLRAEEEALRTYVLANIRKEVREDIKQEIEATDRMVKNSYEGYYRHFVKKGFELIKGRLPKYAQEQSVKTQFYLLEEELQYILHRHFLQKILPKEESRLLDNELNKKLEESYNSIQLQRKIKQLRKKVLQEYKLIVKGHKEFSILTNRFAQRITEASVQYERQVSHLFNIFESKLETEINQELDRQLGCLKFDGAKLSQKVKWLCKQFQYNEWEVNTKEIWQKVSHRVLTQKLFQKIQQLSPKSTRLFQLFDSQEPKLVASFKSSQKQVEKFIHGLLAYCGQEESIELYVHRANEKLRESLEAALAKERTRFRISLVMLGVMMIFCTGEVIWLLRKAGVGKKNRRNIQSLYKMLAWVILLGSVLKKLVQAH